MKRIWDVTRTVLTAANGTTGAGLLLALATGAKIKRGRNGVFIAEGYRRKVPPATCFTIGSVIVTRHDAEWLLHAERGDLFHHESRHAGQYALLGPLFWPAYWLACGYSWTRARDYATRNAFERHAGLAAGGYLTNSAGGDLTEEAGGDLTEEAGGDLTETAGDGLTETAATRSTSRPDESPAPR